MPNLQLMQEFQDSTLEDFLSKRAVLNPPATTFQLSDKSKTFLHRHLNFRRDDQSNSSLESFQAETKTMVATLDYFSLSGGNASSGKIMGTEVDRSAPKKEAGRDYALTGQPVVNVTVDIDVPGIPCYFLPWKSNNAVTMTLGQDARYFFTAAMSGCTFQVIGPPQAPIVSHANAGGEKKELKLSAMDTMLHTAIRQKLNPAWRLVYQNMPITRLQTGSWGVLNQSRVVEVNYEKDPGGAKAQTFQTTIQGLSRDKNTYQTGEIEVEEEVDGNAKEITTTVVGWRPPGSKNWEFYFQVWANFALKRRVYRHEKKTFGKGTNRKVLEKTKIIDYVLLHPGTKFWPGGAGWPDPSANKINR
jgi:hypothetical protein